MVKVIWQRQHRCHTWTVQWYSPSGASVHPTDTCFLGDTRVHNPYGISISAAIFTQLMAECRYTLQWVTSFPTLKIAPSIGNLGPHLIHDYLGSSEPTTQTASRSVQPFFRAQYCDRLTDHATRHSVRKFSVSTTVRSHWSRPHNKYSPQYL